MSCSSTQNCTRFAQSLIAAEHFVPVLWSSQVQFSYIINMKDKLSKLERNFLSFKWEKKVHTNPVHFQHPRQHLPRSQVSVQGREACSSYTSYHTPITLTTRTSDDDQQRTNSRSLFFLPSKQPKIVTEVDSWWGRQGRARELKSPTCDWYLQSSRKNLLAEFSDHCRRLYSVVTSSVMTTEKLSWRQHDNPWGQNLPQYICLQHPIMFMLLSALYTVNIRLSYFSFHYSCKTNFVVFLYCVNAETKVLRTT